MSKKPVEEDRPKPSFDDAKTKIFREMGESAYEMQVLPAGITFAVERLHRERHDLTGEVAVSVNPQNFPLARHYNGMIAIGDLNFSSVQARSSRGKLLEERSGRPFDWYGLLEEFVMKVMSAERMGKPGVVMADIELPTREQAEQWTIGGIPILQDLPMVLYGDASSGKSYLSLWIAGQLAQRFAQEPEGGAVGYIDWEFDGIQHKKRLDRLFKPAPRNIIYIRCDSSMHHQTDRLMRLIKQHNIRYAVCDSIGFAIDGPAEAQDSARLYFKALRSLGIGTMNLAHIPKAQEGREAQIFGSVFFKAGARSAWFVDKASDNPRGELRCGVHHRKSNIGALLSSRGFRLVFEGEHTTRIETIDPKTVDELTVQLPLLDRVKRELSREKMTQKGLAETLDVPIGSIKSILSRHKSQFIKLGNSYGVLAAGEDF